MEVRRLAATAVLIALLTLPPSTGCGLLSQMMYWGRGQRIPAECTQLKSSRVAVVCVSDGSSYGTGTESQILAREVASILKQNVKDIELVRPDEIADWVDKNGWDQIDYREVGRGVKAERVVAIDLAGFQLYEGTSLYKGRASVTVTVFDMTDGGKESFRKELPEFTFPATGPYPVGDTSETQFRRAFIRVIAQHAAKYFHDYDIGLDFTRDPAFIGS